MYELNLCSPYWSISPVGFNLSLIRYLLLIVLIFLFLMYMILLAMLKKSVKNLKKEEDIEGRLAQKQDFVKKWEREFLLILGDHAISLGFVMCFSPYIFETILSFSFLLLLIIYEYHKHKNDYSIKYFKTTFRIINMALLVCAMVGLSRTEWDNKLHQCRDSDYRNP